MYIIFILLGFLLLFIGVPSSIILTIVFAIMKKKVKYFAFAILICFLSGCVFFAYGTSIAPETVQETKKETVVVANNEETVPTNIPTAEPTPMPTPEPTPYVETEEDYKSSCQEYKYKDVLRNPSDYIGKRVKVKVEISTVHEKSMFNDVKYYFAYDEGEYGYFTGDRYGIFDKREAENPKLLSDDIIVVYGEIADPEYTKSLIISSSELFCIDMKYIDFISE